MKVNGLCVPVMMKRNRKLGGGEAGFPLKLSSLISARRAVSQSGQAPNRAPIHHPTPPQPTPHCLPYQGNLDSWAPALTFCYIYSLREIISLMNSSPGLLELNEDIKMWKNGTKSSEYSLVPQPHGKPVYSEYNPTPSSFFSLKVIFCPTLQYV